MSAEENIKTAHHHPDHRIRSISRGVSGRQSGGLYENFSDSGQFVCPLFPPQPIFGYRGGFIGLSSSSYRFNVFHHQNQRPQLLRRPLAWGFRQPCPPNVFRQFPQQKLSRPSNSSNQTQQHFPFPYNNNLPGGPQISLFPHHQPNFSDARIQLPFVDNTIFNPSVNPFDLSRNCDFDSNYHPNFGEQNFPSFNFGEPVDWHLFSNNNNAGFRPNIPIFDIRSNDCQPQPFPPPFPPPPFQMHISGGGDFVGLLKNQDNAWEIQPPLPPPQTHSPQPPPPQSSPSPPSSPVVQEQQNELHTHGRVQSIKLLEETSNSNNSGRPGKSATVAFIDIRSASKALRNVRAVAGQPIHISYYEPGSAPLPPPSFPPHNNHGERETSVNSSEPLVPPTQGNLNSNATANNNVVVTNNCIPNSPGPGMYRQRFAGQQGQSEDSSSHFYDQPKSFSRGRGDSHGFHGRGRRENRPPFHRHSFPVDNRNYRSQWGYHHEGRYAPPVHSDIEERTPIPSPVTHTPPIESGPKPPRRAESPASSVSSRHLISKRRRSRSVSDSGSSDRASSVGTRSRSGSRSSVSTSVSSSRSRSPSHHGHFPRGTGSNDRFHHSGHSRHRYSRSRVLTRASDSRIRHNSRSPLAASPSSSTSSSPSPHRKISATHSPSHSPSSSKSYSPSRNAGGSQHHNSHHQHRRAPNSAELLAAIRIRNLPIRSSDTSLKDGLYHEYKKHGKVAWVRVHGNGQERFAIVCFKSAEHATRAVSVSQGKSFFGCKIQVTPYKHAKGEDIMGGQDEENRLLVEDEPTSVGYPTRTVLITGLDASVTSAELQSVFDQYGDIVRLEIRKQGTATHAICEFVDIASAIRAQWGRHVFKSKEARISFFRNPPTNALMLDGIAGVNDKQVYGQCCQYGAIKEIVMDPERVLALVQFQEISEAQAAIRQLRSWVIKGKRLQVDFASNEVIRRVVQRVTGVIPSPVGSSSPGLISSPSIGNSIAPLHDTINLGRRMNKPEEEDEVYNTLEDPDSYRVSKTDRNMRRIIPSSKSQLASINSVIGTVDSAVFQNDKAPYSIRPYASPVSPDPDHSVSGQQTSTTSAKCSSTSKIDFNCHETDSAVVTSSSDIVIGVAEKNDIHSNSGMSFDDTIGYTESDGEIRGSLDTSHGALTFVDGVSSTSPEPKSKSETVRKASPDSVSVHSVPRPSIENRTTFFKGVADPRRQPSSFKIRRSSADSGNNAGAMSSHMHSTSNIPTSCHPQASTTADGTNLEDNENEGDDRPGTPLCDENPESFESPEVPPIMPSSKSSSFTLSTKIDPISLPLPEFALQTQRHRTNSNTSSKEFPSSSVSVSRGSFESDVKSPIKSPALPENNAEFPSPMEVDNSLTSMEEESVSPTSNSVWKEESRQIASPDPVIYRRHSNDTRRNWSSPVKDLEQHLSNSVSDTAYKDQDTIGSPDSDAGISPSSVSLEQRILKCCETYDRFSGGKSTVEIPFHSDVISDANCSVPHTLKSASSTDSSLDSPSSRFKFLNWSELVNRPSDIGKSVLARKSVFDEDTKRLENFGEKYEAKGPSTPTSSTTWRAIALQRSLSVSSAASSSNSSSWHPQPHLHMNSTNSASPSNLPHTNASAVTPTMRSLSVSATTVLNNFSPKLTPTVFQPTQSKPQKDLNSSMPHNSSKPVRVDSSKPHPPHPPPLTPTHSLQANFCQNKPSFPKPCIETPKSPNGKTIDFKDNKEKPQTLDSWNSSVTTVTLPVNHEISGGIEKSSPVPCPTSTTIVARPVERSLSLDSKKVSSSGSWNQTNVSTIPTPPVNEPSTSSECKGVSRRSSVDSPLLGHLTQTQKNLHPEPLSDPSCVSLKTEAPSPPCVVSTSMNSNTSPSIDKPSKETILQKTDLELMKRDISGIRPLQQETTVAVVAAEQITFIPSRSDSVTSSSTKDSSKKDKEKKRRSSGTSTPVSSLPPSNFLTATTRSDTSTMPQTSSRENISAAKRVDDKKDKKERDVKLTGETNSVESTERDDGSKKSGDKDKRNKKEKREGHKDKDISSEHRSSLNDSRHQQTNRREKDYTSSKRKRDNSGNEGEREIEQKKVKVEKEVHDVTLHRLKAATTNERRESRDSSCSNKDKNKEAKDSSSRTSSISQPEAQVPKDKKEESKSKENHYRSKDKSSSSKDKHYDKPRTSSETRAAHQASKSDHSSKDKDRSKKERAVSPGKENVKGSSKHHTHSSSSHRSSSKKESTSSGGGSSKQNPGPESNRRPQVEKHNTSIDSDSCGEFTAPKCENSSDPQVRSKSSKSQSKSSRSEKRDSNDKRERHRSGDSDRTKNREQQKKKKRFVVEETESSDSDDEEKKKHHSIFEVVIDEYVSMYDKVKARSNRACKAQPHQPQVEDAKKKEDKIKDQFRALKQSRAKKIEKKRSTSVDESNKSGVHTSSDEETLQESVTTDTTHVRPSKPSTDLDTGRDQNLTQTSDDEDAHNERSRAKSVRKMKTKNKKSSNEKLLKRRGKKFGKSPPPKSFQRSMESVFTNSECESNASSSHAEPQMKKKKFSASKLSFPDAGLKSGEYKSSGESISGSDNSVSTKHEQKVNTTKGGLNKLQATDVYSSDSDSSVASGPVRLPTPPVKMSSGKVKNKEKLSKQKSMKKSLFESSDSSEEEKRPIAHDTRKEKKENQRSKSKDRESKIGRKKHRGHVTLSKSGKSKSRVGSGDGNVDTSTLVGKRESTSTMKDILFGPMSATSGSENDEARSYEHAPPRPKTPTIVAQESPRKMSEAHSPRKSKSITSEERKYSRSISPCSSLDLEKVDSNKLCSSVTTEKKRKKHHKDKKSKKVEGDEHHKSSKLTPTSELKPDLDSLFNSPRVSPSKEYLSPRLKHESISDASSHFLENRASTASPIKNNLELNPSGNTTKSMFSSDEDDDDDKLKIDINEAIIASSDEPGLDISDTMISNDKRKREEEEKQMNSLFEQDKAIESIVLLDRKSPPASCTSAQEDDVVKDDLPKDGTAISQEETEDAVAALLETLEGDDDMEETRPDIKPPAISTTMPSVHSPPTLRIVEDTPFVASDSIATIKQEKITTPPTSWQFESDPKSSLDYTPSLEIKYDKPTVPTTPDIISRKSSLDSTTGSLEDKNADLVLPVRRMSCSTKSRQGSSERENDEVENASADIYEFHDSDDEKSNKRNGQVSHANKAAPIAGSDSTVKTPVSSPPLAQPATVVITEVKTPLVSPNPPVPSSHSITIGTQPDILPVQVQPALSPTFTPKSYTPVTPVSADPFTIKPPVMTPGSRTPPAVQGPRTPPAGQGPKPQLLVTTPPAPVRNKVDDTIEHVIRMAVQSEEPFSIPTSTVTITSVKANARGRSRSRDSGAEETGPVSITRVYNRSEIALHLPATNLVTITLPGSQALDTMPRIKIEPETNSGKDDNATETLIDPQTGILMPMIRQSDEGQYVPIAGQESNGGLPKVQQPQFSVPCFQKEHDGPRPILDEKPHISHPVPNVQKSEGLAATMFSHPQVFQISGQNQYVIPHTSAPTKILSSQPRFSTVMPGHRQISPEASATIYMTKSPHYTGPALSQGQNHGIIMPNSSSPGRITQDFGQPLHKIQDSIPVSISHLGAGPMIRAVFPGQPGIPQMLQPGQYQYAVISKTGELPPSQPSTRQTPVPPQPMMQNIAKYGAPSSGPHGQTEIKSFQIPIATTITKVNTSQEEAMQRKNNTITSQASIMLSSPVTSLRSVSPNVVGAKTYMSSAPSMSMTRQQIQQHHAQTELFHKTTEGLIRVVPRDDLHGGKSLQPDITQPPRVDINVNIAHAAASSPKGRIIGHDQYQSMPSRMPQYTLAESGEVRIVSTPNTSIPDHSGFIQQREYPHYSVPAGSPPTSSHGPRPVVPEKMDFNKLNPMLVHERNRIAQNIQQHSMPHLPPPHAIDQRNSDSPVMSSMYASPHAKSHLYPSPAHQPQGIPRDNFAIYADQVERQHSNSPSYPPSFDPRVPNIAPDRERVLSPYAIRETVLAHRPVYSPPPAHGRYSVPPQSSEGPGNDRQLRIMNSQTPPHPGQVPPQGDSLLMLLQRYPIMWQGLLALKNENAACQMHFVSGNLDVARDSLPANPDGSIPPLRINQRMKLEPSQLDGVARKMQKEPEHCILLALPCGRDHRDVLQQSNNLRNGFITYLQLKQAAGIVNICHQTATGAQPAYVIHIFPSCDFANENLARIAPDLLHGVADIAHLLIVIATV